MSRQRAIYILQRAINHYDPLVEGDAIFIIANLIYEIFMDGYNNGEILDPLYGA